MPTDARKEPETQASEEAIHEFYNNWKDWPASRIDAFPDEVEQDKERTAKLNADFLADIREFVDRVSGQALERAAKAIEESARDGRAGLPMFSAVRAGTLCQAASIVRALIPGEK